MREKYSRCAIHDCEYFVFEFTTEVGGLELPIIDSICPVCWVKENFQGQKVRDFIQPNEEQPLGGLVFSTNQVFYCGRIHGIDPNHVHFEYFDLDALLDVLAGARLDSVIYLPGDEDTAPFLRLDFANRFNGKCNIWALVDVSDIHAQITSELLDKYIPD